MAHTCPECYSYCTCNGDIDDIDWGEDYMCVCCDSKQDDDWEDDEQWIDHNQPLDKDA